MSWNHCGSLVSSVWLAALAFVPGIPLLAEVVPGGLTCEYLENPIGIDVRRPRLSWILESTERGQRQSAYQVLVASTREKLAADEGDLWDSDRVDSDQSVHVVYGGEMPHSRTRLHWKVRAWDRDREPGPFSEPAVWETGLLEPTDWKGRWISAPAADGTRVVRPSPFFRREFTVEREVERARIYISGLGYHEVQLNGEKVGDHVLDPAFTRYDRRVLYVTHDVTAALRRGQNTIGVILGNGWYNMHTRAVWDFDKAPWRDRPSVMAQLEIRYSDGSSLTIATDGTWKVTTGPILFESIRNGTVYDARLERPGWSAPGHDDGDWLSAQEVAGPAGTLAAQMLPPIKVMATLKPVSVAEPKPGVFVFDIGQNVAGWTRLRVSGPEGARVKIRHAERLAEDGTIDQEEISKFVKQWEFQTDTYVLRGEGEEVWEPRFAYHGFQYVEVTGFPGKPTLDSLQARVVHTAFEPAGRFECSNALFNRIQECTTWAYIGNFHGYPTDCPHREKNGWTGDAHLAAELGLYNYHSAAAYTKWLDDLRDEQRPGGELPGIVPTGGWGYAWGNGPAWDSAYVLIPWYLHQYRGDRRILETHYDRLKRYVDYLTGRASDGIVAIGLGDWAPAKTQTPEKVTSTGYYYRDALIVSRIADLLDRPEDAKRYRELAGKIREAFHREFYDAETGLYAGGTQTAMSCALFHGLVPEAERERVVANLVEGIEGQDGHLDAGILGTKYLLRALTEAGRADVVYTMATRTTFPGWGRWVKQGATTLWEQWDGSGSRNHIMFGDISRWFFAALAGIRPDPRAVGFKRSIVRPHPLGDLTWVRAEHESPYGPIRSAWKHEGEIFTLELTVPVNTLATVFIPTSDPDSVRESGIPPEESGGVIKPLGREKGAVVVELGSGEYRFESKLVTP